MSVMKLSTRCTGADAPAKTPCGLVTFILLVSCSAPVTRMFSLPGVAPAEWLQGYRQHEWVFGTVIAGENECAGGVTSAGVSAVDGNYNLPGG